MLKIDERSTVAAVKKALEDQIEKVPEDGLFIFTYSGHGGQYDKSSTAKDETDGKDEFLCLYDGALIDNDLWVIFNKCKGRVFFVADCCHSGTIYRLPGDACRRSLCRFGFQESAPNTQT